MNVLQIVFEGSPYQKEYKMSDYEIKKFLPDAVKAKNVVRIRVINSKGSVIFNTATYESVEDKLVNENTYDINNYLG